MLKGEKVVLRTYRRSDIPAVYELSADFDDMGDHWPCDFMSEFKLEESFKKNGCWGEHSGGLLITEPAGRTVGQIFFFKGVHYGSGYEIGYRIFKPAHMGKGYATDALRLLVGYLFDRKPCNRIQATTLKGNGASQRVIEKCGFKREGVLRQAVFHRGRHRDLQMNSITRKEWEALQGASEE